jgi:hypothetical protein
LPILVGELELAIESNTLRTAAGRCRINIPDHVESRYGHHPNYCDRDRAQPAMTSSKSSIAQGKYASKVSDSASRSGGLAMHVLRIQLALELEGTSNTVKCRFTYPCSRGPNQKDMICLSYTYDWDRCASAGSLRSIHSRIAARLGERTLFECRSCQGEASSTELYSRPY